MPDVNAARLINEIVVGEECDEVRPHHYMSHFDLYSNAMKELGADPKPSRALVEGIRSGLSVHQALDQPLVKGAVPKSTLDFVRQTMEYANPKRGTHEVCAYFLIGREDPIPAMFQNFLDHFPVRVVSFHLCRCMLSLFFPH